MKIVDTLGKFEFILGESVVVEKIVGRYNIEDYQRYRDAFDEIIFQHFNEKNWAKISDLRWYNYSSVNNGITKHIEDCLLHNLSYIAIITADSITKVQMESTVGTLIKENDYDIVDYSYDFKGLEQAITFLNSKGYKFQ